jgi:uncharacterized LabA/DUF88 family protein/cold shock CspA family protein
MRTDKLLRIGVFYDGQLFYNISNFYNYEHERKSRIAIGGLQNYIRRKIAEYYTHDINMCQIVEAHYFRGRHSAQTADDKRQLFGDRQFDDILMSENIVTHYWPLRLTPLGGYEEKGIDVWLALEAYELAVLNKCDVVVLLVMDGDYVPLVRKIQALGIQVVLLYWEYAYQNKYNELKETKVSSKLLRAVSHSISVSEEIDKSPKENLINQLFVRSFDERDGFYEKNGGMYYPESKPVFASVLPNFSATEYSEGAEIPVEESVILSLKNGYGFIRDDAVGNVFFHHSNLENADFDALEVDMEVRYTKVQEADKRYNAKQVWIKWKDFEFD